jgi:hypothetical protein
MPNKVFSHLDGQVLYHVTDKNSGTGVGISRLCIAGQSVRDSVGSG